MPGWLVEACQCVAEIRVDAAPDLDMKHASSVLERILVEHRHQQERQPRER